MSWLARSIAATLSSAPSDDDDDESNSGDKSPDRAADAEEDEQPDTPSRGVKGDISELTESLTRRFWGVATFLAPPPPPAEAEAEAAETEVEDGAQSPRVAGIRSDLAEIGGRVRSGISMLSNANAVAEISKLASSFLPFVPEEEDDEVEAVGVTEEVVVFVRHVSAHPETWLDFPLLVDDRYADDFELSDTQYEHALAIERIVPSLSYLRTELCSTNMSEACFWKIYFVLLHSKLNKQDAELLSTTQQYVTFRVCLVPSYTSPWENCGSHKSVAEKFDATKCGKSWQKNLLYESTTDGPYQTHAQSPKVRHVKVWLRTKQPGNNVMF